MERTHRQLRTRLTDRLGRDDTHGLADVDELTGRHRAAVAGRADADGRLAGEHRADLDLRDAAGEQLVEGRVADVVTGVQHDVALGVHRVRREVPRVHAGLDVLRPHDLAVAVLLADRHHDAARGAAVGLADDDVLRHVHQTPGQVTRVGGPQRRVRQALPGTVGRDEVLRHRQALTEVGLDRTRDVLTLRVRHQATHTGQGPDLRHVARRAGLHDHRDRVVARQRRLHDLVDLFGGLRPHLDELVVPLGVRQLTTLVALLHLGGLALVLVEDGRLAHRGEHVRDGDGDTRPGRPVETGVLQAVQGLRDLGHRVPLGEVVHDRGLPLLRHRLVHERVVRWQ